MPAFGTRSREKLDTVHPRLVSVCEAAIQVYDFTVLEGFRNEERQNLMVEQGQSKLSWPDSKHNRDPSLAVDIAPYLIDWEDLDRFYFLSGVMFMAADMLGDKIRWGGDWNSNFDFTDQRFFDLPHFELLEG